MKKILTAFMPALALLTLGSCASTSQLSSTESDGVYYSSKDHTTQNATASTVSYGQSGTTSQGTDAATGDAVNPDYNGTGSTGSAASSSAEYYDNDYGYAARIRRFHQPAYRGFGYGYYDFAYTDPFWYSGGYSPYGWGPGYYGSLYDPFYNPYSYYGGSYISISIGFGRPYYNPWRYGYGGYGYGGYGYGGGYYDGYRNGYYSGLYNNNYGYGSHGSGYRAKTYYGPRRDGATNAMSASGGQATSGRGRGRLDNGGVVNPGGVATPTGGRTATLNSEAGADAAVQPNRGRSQDRPAVVTPQDNGGRVQSDDRANTGRYTRDQILNETPVRGRDTRSLGTDEQPVRSRDARNDQILSEQPTRGRTTQGEQPLGNTTQEQPRLSTESDRGGRWRNQDNGNNGTVAPATPQDYAQPRGRMRSEQMGSEQPQPQYSRPQRVYNEQPQQQSEQYSRPQRSYSEPSRSYSQPSGGGSFPSNSGGGGGGGGSRGRGRMQ